MTNQHSYRGRCSPDSIATYLAIFARKLVPLVPEYVSEAQTLVLDYLHQRLPDSLEERLELKRLLSSADWKKIFKSSIGRGPGMDGTSSWLWKRIHERFDTFICDLFFTVMISGYCRLLWICDFKTFVQKPGKPDEEKTYDQLHLSLNSPKSVKALSLIAVNNRPLQTDSREGGQYIPRKCNERGCSGSS